MNFRKIYLLALLLVAQFSHSQEGLPVIQIIYLIITICFILLWLELQIVQN